MFRVRKMMPVAVALATASVLAIALPVPAMAQADSTARLYSADHQEGWLGMGLSCSNCSYARGGGPDNAGWRWTFSAAPSVFSVDDGGPADRAGIRAGDTLVAIDGLSLTSPRGGEAFGSVKPGQRVVIRYRRDGAERSARLTAVARPARGDSYAFAQSLRQMQRELRAQQARQLVEAQRQATLAQRQMEKTQHQLQDQREYLQQVMEQVAAAQAASHLTDSARQESLRLYAEQLDSAAAQWRLAESIYAVPAVPAVAAVPALPALPVPAAVPAQPLPPEPLAPADWRRQTGPVRYTGRLGNAVIEVRGRGEVATSEVSDSAVVITSHDMSVRIALRPRDKAAPRPPRAAAPAPAAAPAAPAAPAPRPPRD